MEKLYSSDFKIIASNILIKEKVFSLTLNNFLKLWNHIYIYVQYYRMILLLINTTNAIDKYYWVIYPYLENKFELKFWFLR